jgi:hypothetical protein
MDPQIEFEDIESPSLRQQAKDLMEDMVQLFPSDSAVKATFKHFHNSFIAEVKVASESAYMTAVHQAAALGDVLDSVREKLMGQIIDWRMHRFAAS